MTTVTLIDGRVMYSPCWQHTTEQQMLTDQVAAMFRLRGPEKDSAEKSERALYLDDIEGRFGDKWRAALQERFTAEWNAMQGKKS